MPAEHLKLQRLINAKKEGRHKDELLTAFCSYAINLYFLFTALSEQLLL